MKRRIRKSGAILAIVPGILTGLYQVSARTSHLSPWAFGAIVGFTMVIMWWISYQLWDIGRLNGACEEIERKIEAAETRIKGMGF
jgi:hypothetical protein